MTIYSQTVWGTRLEDDDDDQRNFSETQRWRPRSTPTPPPASQIRRLNLNNMS